jgi:hypothetical protein
VFFLLLIETSELKVNPRLLPDSEQVVPMW